MRASRSVLGISFLCAVLSGCQCGNARPGGAEAPADPEAHATGLALNLEARSLLGPAALAPLEGVEDGSRSGRRPGTRTQLVRVPPFDGPVVAYEPDGELAWQTDVGRLHPGATALGELVVVRGRTRDEDGIIRPTLTALELSTGAIRWQHRDPEALHFGVPAAAGEEIYAMRVLPERCLGVAVVHAPTGEANDPIDTPCLRFVTSSPLELWEASIRPDGEGAVVLGRHDGEGHALVSLSVDGSVRWRLEAALGVQLPVAPPVVAGAVFLLDRGVRALDRDSGERLWHVPGRAREVALAEGRLYVTDGATVRALSAADGELLYTAELPGARSPRVHGDLLLVEAAAGLTGLSTADGSTRWVHASDDVISTVAMADDAVYVATARHVLRLERATGAASVFAEEGGQHLLYVHSD